MIKLAGNRLLFRENIYFQESNLKHKTNTMKHLESILNQENQWWKYLLVFFIAFLGGQFIGAIPLIVAMVIGAAQNEGSMIKPDNPMDFSAYGIDPNLGLVLMIIPFLVMLFIAILLIKGFHNRTIKQVINGGGAFRWKRFWTGIVIWGAFSAVTLIVVLLVDPENFEFNFHLSSFIPLVLISVLLIPFQAGTEEFFFRGYLAQGVGAWTRNRILVILIPAIFFALMHSANPEVKDFGFWTTMPSYLLFGIFFGVITILDDGIELAVGVHAVNNVFTSIFVTSKSSVLQTPAMFIQKEVDPTGEFWGLLITTILFMVSEIKI